MNAATGELSCVTYSDSTPELTFTYNRLGKQTRVTDAVGSRTFAYNSHFKLTSETIDGIYSKTLTRSYATSGFMGRYTGLNIGTEYNVGYGYDAYGRLNQVTSGTDVFSYGYLSNSDLVSTITRPGNLFTTFTYESNRNLVTGVENKYNDTTISGYGYANDAIGRRTSMSRSGTAFAQTDALIYTYNDRSEVTGAVSNNISTYDYGFNFDNIGNRLTSRLIQDTTSYTANNVNQYTSITTPQGATLPTYDDDGNMLSNLDGWAYTWNGENRLVSATNATTRLEFSYDYMGRRVEKKVYTGSSDNWTLTKHKKFVYDGFKLIEKLDGANSNALVQKFTWQPTGLDIPLAVFDVAANTSYYYFSGANKNIGQLMDTSGNLVAKYEYSPFGRIVSASGSYTDANPFRFSSEYYDVETGLIYYNYRYYSPDYGRWTKKDKIGERGGLLLYGFTRNMPVMLWDKNGLFGVGAEGGISFPGAPPEFPVLRPEPDEPTHRCCGNREMSTDEDCCDSSASKTYKPKTECCFEKEVLPQTNIGQVAVVCCRAINASSVLEAFAGSFVKHCELKVGSTCDTDTESISLPKEQGNYTIKLNYEEKYPVYKSNSGSLPGGKPCKCATEGDILKCLSKNSYNAGTGVPFSNCQTNTNSRINTCCLTTSWSPQILTGW